MRPNGDESFHTSLFIIGVMINLDISSISSVLICTTLYDGRLGNSAFHSFVIRSEAGGA